MPAAAHTPAVAGTEAVAAGTATDGFDWVTVTVAVMTGGLPQSSTADCAVSLGVATCAVDGLPAAATLELAHSCFGIRIIDLLRGYVGNEQSLRNNTSC